MPAKLTSPAPAVIVKVAGVATRPTAEFNVLVLVKPTFELIVTNVVLTPSVTASA